MWCVPARAAVFSVPVAEAGTAETLAWLRAHGIWTIAATPQARLSYTEVDMRGPVAIAVGAEKPGLSSAWLDGADFGVLIPMVGRVNSLNVSIASALLIYESDQTAPLNGFILQPHMKPITYDSLTDIVYVEDVKVSPDGSRASFVRLSIDGPANEYVRSILATRARQVICSASSLLRLDAKMARRAGLKMALAWGLSPPAMEKHRCTSFLSQVVRPHSVTSHPNGVSDFDWSPDGKRIVFTALMRSDECVKEDEKHDAPPEEKKEAWEKKRERELREHEDALRF